MPIAPGEHLRVDFGMLGAIEAQFSYRNFKCVRPCGAPAPSQAQPSGGFPWRERTRHRAPARRARAPPSENRHKNQNNLACVVTTGKFHLDPPGLNLYIRSRAIRSSPIRHISFLVERKTHGAERVDHFHRQDLYHQYHTARLAFPYTTQARCNIFLHLELL